MSECDNIIASVVVACTAKRNSGYTKAYSTLIIITRFQYIDVELIYNLTVENIPLFILYIPFIHAELSI